MAAGYPAAFLRPSAEAAKGEGKWRGVSLNHGHPGTNAFASLLRGSQFSHDCRTDEAVSGSYSPSSKEAQNRAAKAGGKPAIRMEFARARINHRGKPGSMNLQSHPPAGELGLKAKKQAMRMSLIVVGILCLERIDARAVRKAKVE